MPLVDHSQHFSAVGCASLCHWSSRPLDTHRHVIRRPSTVGCASSALEALLWCKASQETSKEKHKRKIGADFVSSSILDLDFDLLRFPEAPGRPSCVAVAGASLVLSLKGKIVSNLFLPSNDRLISDSLWLFCWRTLIIFWTFWHLKNAYIFQNATDGKFQFVVNCLFYCRSCLDFFLPYFLPSFLAWFLAFFFLAFSNSKFRHRGCLCDKFCSGFWSDFLQNSS